jgi:hypothetical protein
MPIKFSEDLVPLTDQGFQGEKIQLIKSVG